MRHLASVISALWHTMAYTAVVVLVMFLLLPPGWILIPGVVIGAIAIRARLRRMRATLLLTYLDHAIALNLPLPPMLAAVERSERGPLGAQAALLRGPLEAGAALDDALAMGTPGLAPRVRGLLVAASRMGRLPQMLRHVLRSGNRQSATEQLDPVMGSVWVAVVVASFTGLLLMVTVFVIPNFEKIFDDFDTSLPLMTVSLIDASRWLSGRLPGQALPGIVWVPLGLMLAGGIVLLGWRTQAGRALRDRIAWCVPIVHGVLRDRGLADVCRLTAEATDGGIPLPDALAEAAAASTNTVLAPRVARWARMCRAGVPVAEAVVAARLPALLAGILGTAAEPAPALAFLARHYGSRCHHAWDFMLQVARVAVVLAVAAPVAWVVIGLFLPMVRLINAMLPLGPL